MSGEIQPVASSTKQPHNRFKVTFYVKKTPEGQLISVGRRYRKAALFTFTITVEYPSYGEEVEMFHKVRRFDDANQSHFIDQHQMTEDRVRRCLVSWDLHEQSPHWAKKKLHRMSGLLDDESLDYWKELPPLLRKAIADTINDALGAP